MPTTTIRIKARNPTVVKLRLKFAFENASGLPLIVRYIIHIKKPNPQMVKNPANMTCPPHTIRIHPDHHFQILTTYRGNPDIGF